MITFFWKKRPLKGKFSKKLFHLTEPRLVCKFREIGLTGNWQSRALFTWQKQKFRKVSRSPFCEDRAGPAPNNILGVPQISSKSVHFRRNCSRTRELTSLKLATKYFQYSAKLLRRAITTCSPAPERRKISTALRSSNGESIKVEEHLLIQWGVITAMNWDTMQAWLHCVSVSTSRQQKRMRCMSEIAAAGHTGRDCQHVRSGLGIDTLIPNILVLHYYLRRYIWSMVWSMVGGCFVCVVGNKYCDFCVYLYMQTT